MMVMQTRRFTEDEGIGLYDDAIQQRLRVRVRREVVAFLADLADASRPDRAAGVIGFNPLLNYPANTVGARLKSIVTGIGEGQPWGDVDALLADLDGRIDLAQLHATVQSALDLITADASTVNSVNARLSQESQARVQALLDEAQARASEISTAIGELQTTLVAAYEAGDSTVNSRITTEVALSQDRDSALGARVDTVTARLDSGDIFSSIATALSYAYSKAAVDTAIASSGSTLTTAFQTADGTLNTRITNEANASSDRDTALGTRVDTVTARLDTGDVATSLANALNYAYTKAQTDSAVATLGSTLTSAYTDAINGVSARLNAGGDIATSLATANSYAYTKAQSDSALSELSTTLTSAYTGAINGVSARLNAGGDIATSLATANSYAYTKAQSDSALSSLSTTLTSAYEAGDNAINARLNAGGDISTSLATANSYAYTKAQSDLAMASQASTLRAEFNPINARLNSGGDIHASLATALTYAYTKATIDGAFASQASTLRGEYQGPLGALSGSVSTLQTAVSGPTGVQSQYVLKTVATRSDGRPVIGYVGLASTASNDGTGASELILQAGRTLFVPDDSPNAAPVQMLELGLVNGVYTLRVPAARIGDLTVGTLKIEMNAVTVPTGAELTSDATFTGTTPVTLLSVNLDTAGQPLLVFADMAALNSGSSFAEAVIVGLFVNGTQVRQWSLVQKSVVVNRAFVSYIAAPGAGTITVELRAWCSLAGFYGQVLSNGSSTWFGNGGTAIGALGCKR